MNPYTNRPITEWALEDRPREKLMQRGISSLTDAEILALIISSGTRTLSAIDLARKLIETFGSIEKLAEADLKDLTKISGVGNAKAITILASFEISRRKIAAFEKPRRILFPEELANYLKPRMEDLRQEVFWAIFLNRNNEIIAEKQLFEGGVSSTIVDSKIVYREALNHLASGIMLCHNHPSGSLEPSKSDIDLTRKLRLAGETMDIALLDHLIISKRGYFSFADGGLLA